MVPIYEQIADQIKTLVRDGELKENDNLPSVRALSKDLRISALTVKKAYDSLEGEGFAVTVHGKGTYIAAVNPGLLMEEQKNVTNMGGSMRLGAYDCVLKKGSKAYEAYGQAHIQERHRHRFEFNSEYRDKFEAAGMMCVGENPESNLVEVVEIPSLKWFVGVQFHPEYNSTVVNPNPLFVSFVKAAVENKK